MVTIEELDTCISVIQELFPDYYKIMRADLTKEQTERVAKELEAETNERFWNEKIDRFTVFLDDFTSRENFVEFDYEYCGLSFSVTMEIDYDSPADEEDSKHGIWVEFNENGNQDNIWDTLVDSKEMIKYLDDRHLFFGQLENNIREWAKEELSFNEDLITYLDRLREIVGS